MEIKIPVLILLAGLFMCEAFVLTFSAIRASRKMLGGKIWNIYLFYTLSSFLCLLSVLWVIGKILPFNWLTSLMLALVCLASFFSMVTYNQITTMLNIKLKLFTMRSSISTFFLAILSFMGIIFLIQSHSPDISGYIKLTFGIFEFVLVVGILVILQLFLMWIDKRRTPLFRAGLPFGMLMGALSILIMILQLFILFKNPSGFPYFPFFIQAGLFTTAFLLGLTLVIETAKLFSPERKKREILGDVYLNLSPAGLVLIFIVLLLAKLHNPSPWGEVVIEQVSVFVPLLFSALAIFLAYLMWWMGDCSFSHLFEGKLRDLNRAGMGAFLIGYFSHFLWYSFGPEKIYLPLFFRFGIIWLINIPMISAILLYFTLIRTVGLKLKFDKNWFRTFVILYLLFCIFLFSLYFIPLKFPSPSIFEEIVLRWIMLVMGAIVFIMTIFMFKMGLKEFVKTKELKATVICMAIYRCSMIAFFLFHFYYLFSLKSYIFGRSYSGRGFYYIIFASFFTNILIEAYRGLKYVKLRESFTPFPMSLREMTGLDRAKQLLDLLNASTKELKILVPPETFQETLIKMEAVNPKLSLIEYRDGNFVFDGEIVLEREEAIYILNQFREVLINEIKGLKREDILGLMVKSFSGNIRQKEIDLFEFASATLFEFILNDEINKVPNIISSPQQKRDLIDRLRKKDPFFLCLKEVETQVVVSAETIITRREFRLKLFEFIQTLEEFINKKVVLSASLFKEFGFNEAEFFIRPGHVYLIKEEEPYKSFWLFSELIKREIPGICFTRKPPIFLRDKYGISRERIWWLSDLSAQDCINPTDLEGVMGKINNFIKNNEDGVILLEDLVIFIVKHSFIRALSMIAKIQEWIESTNISFIACVGTYVLSEKEMDALSRGMEVFDGNL